VHESALQVFNNGQLSKQPDDESGCAGGRVSGSADGMAGPYFRIQKQFFKAT